MSSGNVSNLSTHRSSQPRLDISTSTLSREDKLKATLTNLRIHKEILMRSAKNFTDGNLQRSASKSSLANINRIIFQMEMALHELHRRRNASED